MNVSYTSSRPFLCFFYFMHKSLLFFKESIGLRVEVCLHLFTYIYKVIVHTFMADYLVFEGVLGGLVE